MDLDQALLRWLLDTDPALRWEVKGRRHAAFTTDFDYRSGT